MQTGADRKLYFPIQCPSAACILNHSLLLQLSIWKCLASSKKERVPRLPRDCLGQDDCHSYNQWVETADGLRRQPLHCCSQYSILSLESKLLSLFNVSVQITDI